MGDLFGGGGQARIDRQLADLRIQSKKDRPTAPVFQTPIMRNEAGDLTWQLPEHMLLQNTYDQTGLNMIKEQATQMDPYASPWANLMLQQVSQQQAAGMDSLSQQRAGAEAQARSQLAMRGGLGGGAAERLAAMGQRNALFGAQDLTRQAAQSRLGIGLQGEQQRQAAMMALPGMELSRSNYEAGIQGQNIGTMLDQARLYQEAQQRAYEEQMKAWAAQRQAEATIMAR